MRRPVPRTCSALACGFDCRPLSRGAASGKWQDQGGSPMSAPFRDVLAFAGRNGPAMLFGGVLLGLVAPPLADAARPLLGIAVFVFTLGAFLKVDLASFQKETEQRAWI